VTAGPRRQAVANLIFMSVVRRALTDRWQTFDELADWTSLGVPESSARAQLRYLVGAGEAEARWEHSTPGRSGRCRTYRRARRLSPAEQVRQAVSAAITTDGWTTFHAVRDRACATVPGTSDTNLRRALADLIADRTVETRMEYPPYQPRRLVFRRTRS
jgi:hypothetical protein